MVIKPWSLKCQMFLSPGSAQPEPICCGISGRTCLLKQAQAWSGCGEKTQTGSSWERMNCAGAFLYVFLFFPVIAAEHVWEWIRKISHSSQKEFWFQFSHLKGSWGTAIRTFSLSDTLCLTCCSSFAGSSHCEDDRYVHAKESSIYIFVRNMFVGIN